MPVGHKPRYLETFAIVYAVSEDKPSTSSRVTPSSQSLRLWKLAIFVQPRFAVDAGLQ